MSIAVEGYGSFIARGPTLGTLTRIAEVTKITGPGMKMTSIDVTNLDSLLNRKEFLSGMVDEGEIKLELNFTSAEWLALRATLPTTTPAGTAVVAGTPALPFWSITFSTGNVCSGQGFLTDLEPTAPVDDKLSATCTIKCSGPWTFT
jgi:hypothetical protein